MSQKHHNRILVVSPRSELRHNLADKIKEWGFRAVTAKDGKEAYEYIHSGQVELIIAEMSLGKVGGIELVERARQEDLVTPFIFLVSPQDRATLKRAAKVRVADFLEMPYQEDQLLTATKAALDLMSSVKRLNQHLKELCRYAHLSPVKTKELLSLQRRSLMPIASQRFPIRRAA